MTDAANTMTRRTLVVGAAACVICAPAIVRVASLMPVRGLPLQLPNLDRKVPKTMGEWYRYLRTPTILGCSFNVSAISVLPVSRVPSSMILGHNLVTMGVEV